jgi:hypothetical protein
MEKMQFAIREDDLLTIKNENVEVTSEGRNYNFEIQEDIDNNIPTIHGRFSFDHMILDLQ